MALCGSKSRLSYLLFAACLTATLVFIFTGYHGAFGGEDLQYQLVESTTATKGVPSLQNTTAVHAYATFLANWPKEHDSDELNDDKYFVATRMLAYQLLHAPETKSIHGYPFIVLVNEHVSKTKRERLAKDGAIVWEPEPVDGKWIHNPHVSTWEYVMTKLRIWELTQFDRICFMDADTVLMKTLDGVFQDPSAEMYRNLDPGQRDGTEPREYIMAGMPEIKVPHHWPPREGEFYDHYMNAGFFVTQPSLTALELYLSFTDTPGIFPPDMPEQNLLNHAHAPDRNMPWKKLNPIWNIHNPSIEDWQGGIASMHARWWEHRETELHTVFESWRWRMEGFFEDR